MVKLPVNANMSIRVSAVELEDGQDAIVSFEMFSYPAGNGGREDEVVVLSKAVPFCSKDPNSTLRPDYDRMTIEAACKLKADFQRMQDVLDIICGNSGIHD